MLISVSFLSVVLGGRLSTSLGRLLFLELLGKDELRLASLLLGCSLLVATACLLVLA